MKFNEINTGRFSTVQISVPPEQVSSGNSADSPPVRVPNTPPYQKGECDPRLIEQQNIYSLHAKRYADKYQIKLALNLESALLERQKGEVTLTLREVDIAARLGVPLDKDFVYKALRAIGGMILEGIPGEVDNPYHLRAYYNRGIKYKKRVYQNTPSDYERASPAKQERADAMMKEILAKLEAHNLAAWPEEIENGFPQELCKPEYMTWDQFNKAQSQTVIRYSSEDQYEPDIAPLTGIGDTSPVSTSFAYGPEQTKHSDSSGIQRSG